MGTCAGRKLHDAFRQIAPRGLYRWAQRRGLRELDHGRVPEGLLRPSADASAARGRSSDSLPVHDGRLDRVLRGRPFCLRRRRGVGRHGAHRLPPLRSGGRRARLADSRGRALGRRRAVVGLFLLALGVRLAAAFLFDRIGEGVGDPFSGSSDAWAYDQWARRLTDAWSQGEWLSLERWDQAGRWDVGFHYVLAGVYSIFGQSVLLGRALVAVFGALAVVFLLEVAHAPDDAGVSPRSVALVYAFWPTSVAWNGYSLLRDAFVWARAAS